ncbi:hypothetical protein ADK33_07060 [Streptomyces griseus subsp. rhodochrous]|nr:hypothetical protein ADK33_07060 [Streptomyces griseus subsp. rhodochrous]
MPCPRGPGSHRPRAPRACRRRDRDALCPRVGLDLDRSRPTALGWWPVMSACRGARRAAPKE